jgi:hypothetical protein
MAPRKLALLYPEPGVAFCVSFQGIGDNYHASTTVSGVPRGGGWGVQTPPEILKALQNRTKLNPIVKTVKNC